MEGIRSLCSLTPPPLPDPHPPNLTLPWPRSDSEVLISLSDVFTIERIWMALGCLFTTQKSFGGACFVERHKRKILDLNY